MTRTATRKPSITHRRKTGKVFKVTLSSDGSRSEKEFVAQVPIDRLENFVFMAPNGTFAAYRKHSNVYTYYFEGR